MNEFFCTLEVFKCVDGQIVEPSILFWIFGVVMAFFITTFFMIIFEPNSRLGPDTLFTVVISLVIAMVVSSVIYGLIAWAATNPISLAAVAIGAVAFIATVYVAVKIRNYRYGRSS